MSVVWYAHESVSTHTMLTFTKDTQLFCDKNSSSSLHYDLHDFRHCIVGGSACAQQISYGIHDMVHSYWREILNGNSRIVQHALLDRLSPREYRSLEHWPWHSYITMYTQPSLMCNSPYAARTAQQTEEYLPALEESVMSLYTLYPIAAYRNALKHLTYYDTIMVTLWQEICTNQSLADELSLITAQTQKLTKQSFDITNYIHMQADEAYARLHNTWFNHEQKRSRLLFLPEQGSSLRLSCNNLVQQLEEQYMQCGDWYERYTDFSALVKQIRDQIEEVCSPHAVIMEYRHTNKDAKVFIPAVSTLHGFEQKSPFSHDCWVGNAVQLAMYKYACQQREYIDQLCVTLSDNGVDSELLHAAQSSVVMYVKHALRAVQEGRLLHAFDSIRSCIDISVYIQQLVRDNVHYAALNVGLQMPSNHITVKTYEVALQAQQYFHAITQQPCVFNRYVGNEYQHVQYQLLVDLLNRTAKLQTDCQSSRWIADLTTFIFDISYQEMRALFMGNYHTAIIYYSLCTALYDVVEHVMHSITQPEVQRQQDSTQEITDTMIQNNSDVTAAADCVVVDGDVCLSPQISENVLQQIKTLTGIFLNVALKRGKPKHSRNG